MASSAPARSPLHGFAPHSVDYLVIKFLKSVFWWKTTSKQTLTFIIFNYEEARFLAPFQNGFKCSCALATAQFCTAQCVLFFSNENKKSVFWSIYLTIPPKTSKWFMYNKHLYLSAMPHLYLPAYKMTKLSTALWSLRPLHRSKGNVVRATTARVAYKYSTPMAWICCLDSFLLLSWKQQISFVA